MGDDPPFRKEVERLPHRHADGDAVPIPGAEILPLLDGDRLPIYACGENRYSIRKDGQLAVNCSFCLAAETETTE